MTKVRNIDSSLPHISFILPTYNAEKYLERCLESIFSQDYPLEKIEVIVADGNSTDRTKEILSKYPVILINNEKRDSDYGKFLALQVSKGEYLAMIDADNIIASESWLSKLVSVLDSVPEALGAESEYLIAKDFSLVNSYSNSLVIVDPLARMLASKPTIVNKNEYILKIYAKESQPVSGANGFIWRKNFVSSYLNPDAKVFPEANLLNFICSLQEVQLIQVPNNGIYHYYSDSIRDYVKKRRKIASKFLGRKVRKENTWVDGAGYVTLFLSSIYLVTIVGPLLEGLYMMLKQRRVSWILHPLISSMTILIYSFEFIKKAFLLKKTI